uniref:IGFBP N-terminal domain-containing protein n=1 Tax=Tetranychus urticae TaxID=32264 RepID=T1KVQ4_TETUR
MKTFLICVILTVTIGKSIAIVCTPDICIRTSCTGPKTETDCDDGKVFVANGGFCGCCNSCVTPLKEGDLCANLFRGSPPTSMCTPPLVCKSFDSSPPRCTNPHASPPFVPISENCGAAANAHAN